MRPLNVLELDLLALVLVLEGERVAMEELELLGREGEEADSPTSIDTELTPSLGSNDSNSDLTTLRIALTTRQETLDQCELGLAAKREWIDGTDEKVKQVQRACGEALGQREEAVERKEKGV